MLSILLALMQAGAPAKPAPPPDPAPILARYSAERQRQATAYWKARAQMAEAAAAFDEIVRAAEVELRQRGALKEGCQIKPTEDSLQLVCPPAAAEKK